MTHPETFSLPADKLSELKSLLEWYNAIPDQISHLFYQEMLETKTKYFDNVDCDFEKYYINDVVMPQQNVFVILGLYYQDLNIDSVEIVVEVIEESK